MFSVDFKKEEEVKDYIQNVGTEYSFQCYKEKTPDGCFRLGDFFAAVKSDFPQAAKAYQKSCDEFNHARGCSKIGAFYLYGKGVDKDREKALHYFNKACERSNMDGCYGAGSILLSNKKGKWTQASDEQPSSPKTGTTDSQLAEQRQQGIQLLEKACKNDHQASCFNLSAIYIKGLSGQERNMKKAAEFSAKSCDLGHVYGCANASRIYKIGDGVEKNESLAKKYKEKAIELQNEVKETNKQMRFGET